ncbi:MAG: NAD(P)/FAD-dependent oxidoreductase [Bacteroidia bacterium]|nr:NAD(P)/FAD-dependent oxidoreductase [Bacteroidia bacterium]
MKDVAVIGGGLAGLINAIVLSRNKLDVILFEKKSYPFHRVCGEYISNEVIPFLKSLDLFPEEFGPSRVSQFQLTSVSGKEMNMPLDLGAFGLSRYAFDFFLYKKALEAGVDIRQNTRVEKIDFKDDHFELESTGKEKHNCRIAVGSFGKRSKLDKYLERNFIQKRSPYVGIKYHARTDHPADLIALHNFEGGYCGISHVENEVSNICYLTERDKVKKFGNIETFQAEVLFKNPKLKSIFENADFLFEKPLVINEISFETKGPVEDHILMCGDAAGMIAPLCGNGMAMAIHAAKICSETILEFHSADMEDRHLMERAYAKKWQKLFSRRLSTGRNVQKLFGNKLISNVAVNTVRRVPPLAKAVMKQTHGEYF